MFDYRLVVFKNWYLSLLNFKRAKFSEHDIREPLPVSGQRRFISEMQKVFIRFDLHWHRFSCLQGQSSEIFDHHFCHHSNLPGLLTNGLKYFRIWLRFRRVIQIFPNLPGVIRNTMGNQFFRT